MTKVLIDACVPHWLRLELATFDVETAHYAGLDHLSDNKLLAAIDGRYEVLVTLDRNLTYQTKIGKRAVAVVVLRVDEQTREAFRSLVPRLIAAIEARTPGAVEVVGP
jgi:uncharacterized protein with PIN domain